MCDSPQPDGLNLFDERFRQFCRGIVDTDGHLQHDGSCNKAVAFQRPQRGRERFLADALQSFQQTGETKRTVVAKLRQDPEAPLIEQPRQKLAQLVLLARWHPGADVADVSIRHGAFSLCHLVTSRYLIATGYKKRDDDGMSRPRTTRDIPAQTGKRIIVTGANSGIGFYTALELARAGAEVTLASRNPQKVQEAAKRIMTAIPNASVLTGTIDTSDPESVSRFAEAQLADSRPIDMLINNAGIMALPKREVSVDGHELQFATNVLGPFRLTGLLLPAILKASAPRVVTVSSFAHTRGGPTPMTDLDSEASYAPVRAYSKTKLENILFTRELQRRAGDRLLATCCHPGASRTNLGNNTVYYMNLITFFMLPILQGAAQGAEPTLMAATYPEAKPGAYYGPGGLFKLRGHPIEANTTDSAKDMPAAKELFNKLEKITNIRYRF